MAPLKLFLELHRRLQKGGPVDATLRQCPEALFGVLFFDPKLSYRQQFLKVRRFAAAVRLGSGVR